MKPDLKSLKSMKSDLTTFEIRPKTLKTFYILKILAIPGIPEVRPKNFEIREIWPEIPEIRCTSPKRVIGSRI